MAASLNSVELIGNVGRPPETRRATSGLAIANFSVAVNEKLKDGKEVTEWFNIVCFGKTAEACQSYLAKGRQVFIEGRLQNSTYDGKDGVKRTKTEIVANKVLFLGKAEQKDTEELPPLPGEALFKHPPAMPMPAGWNTDDLEIPF